MEIGQPRAPLGHSRLVPANRRDIEALRFADRAQALLPECCMLTVTALAHAAAFSHAWESTGPGAYDPGSGRRSTGDTNPLSPTTIYRQMQAGNSRCCTKPALDRYGCLRSSTTGSLNRPLRQGWNRRWDESADFEKIRRLSTLRRHMAERVGSDHLRINPFNPLQKACSAGFLSMFPRS